MPHLHFGPVVGTFADGTVALATDESQIRASMKLQRSLENIWNWLTRWLIKANEIKLVQVTFTRRDTKQLNGREIHQSDEAKYLGIYLGRRLTWRKHMFIKRKDLALKLRIGPISGKLKLYWKIKINTK